MASQNPEKFRGKYRIASTRAQWWDYRRNAAYFITICADDHTHHFGRIDDGKMILSPTGILADIFWHEIPSHHQNIYLGEFIVMPNHIHGILILDAPEDVEDKNDKSEGKKKSEGLESPVQPLHATAPHLHATAPHLHATAPHLHATAPAPQSIPAPQCNPAPKKNEQMAAISPKSNSIPAIIRNYKSAVTKHANRLGIPHAWQSRYHDRIIRDEAEHHRIANYILNNPTKWEAEKNQGKKNR